MRRHPLSLLGSVLVGVLAGSLWLAPVSAQLPYWPINAPNGGAIRTRNVAGTTLALQAYNTTTGTFENLLVLTAGTAPALSSSATAASQTTENAHLGLTLTTDSTFLTGTNVTYSGGRGSSVLKLTGNYSGVNGGFHALYGIVNATGTSTDTNAGIVGVKQVINNTVTQTAGGFTAIQGIAKHNNGTLKAANAAPFIGVEGVANQSAAGQIGTAIGVSAAYHIPAAAAAFDAGAVWRGIQITLDNSSGNNPSEQTGLAVWNMAGTQDQAIKIIKSDGGFTQDIVLQNGETIGNATDGLINLAGANLATTADVKGGTFHVGAAAGCDGTPGTATKGIVTTCTSPDEFGPEAFALLRQEVAGLRAELASLRQGVR